MRANEGRLGRTVNGMTVSAPKWTSVSLIYSDHPRSYTQDDAAILLWTGIVLRLLLSASCFHAVPRFGLPCKACKYCSNVSIQLAGVPSPIDDDRTSVDCRLAQSFCYASMADVFGVDLEGAGERVSFLQSYRHRHFTWPSRPTVRHAVDPHHQPPTLQNR